MNNFSTGAKKAHINMIVIAFETKIPNQNEIPTYIISAIKFLKCGEKHSFDTKRGEIWAPKFSVEIFSINKTT